MGQEDVRALVVFLHIYAVSLHFTYVISIAFYVWNSSVGDSDGSGRCASSGGVSLSMLSVYIFTYVISVAF